MIYRLVAKCLAQRQQAIEALLLAFIQPWLKAIKGSIPGMNNLPRKSILDFQISQQARKIRPLGRSNDIGSIVVGSVVVPAGGVHHHVACCGQALPKHFCQRLSATKQKPGGRGKALADHRQSLLLPGRLIKPVADGRLFARLLWQRQGRLGLLGWLNPEALALKGIGWQGHPVALLLRVQVLPLNCRPGQPTCGEQLGQWRSGTALGQINNRLTGH